MANPWGTLVNERFQNKVDIPKDPWDCYEWLAYRNENGYGMFCVKGKPQRAHRVSFKWSRNRPIREGCEVVHTCDNPSCVNPCHLEEKTHLDNMQDMVDRGRSASGERSGNSKLLPQDVDEIRYLRLQGWTYQAIADRFGIHPKHAGYVARGEYWKER